MAATVTRKPVTFHPNPERVVARLFTPGSDERIASIFERVAKMPQPDIEFTLNQVLREFSQRHRNVTRIFQIHFQRMQYNEHVSSSLVESLSEKQRLLLGAYFTHEYSIEASAFFNPSIVPDPDQSNVEDDEMRVILSFRAVGEGHISSIVFRRGVLNKANQLQLDEVGPYVDMPEQVRRHEYDKKQFLSKLADMNVKKDVVDRVMEKLGDRFIYGKLQQAIAQTRDELEMTPSKSNVIDAINWVAGSHYEITFSYDTALSERVIFPISYTESNGIEDARFVRFEEDGDNVTYYAVYTAYNGYTILPKFLQTNDFYHFKSLPLHGPCVQNKGLAFFPRRINGRFAMLSRLDGINNYIMFSDNIHVWKEAEKIQEPRYPWELVQVGNCGSPLETKAGWLVLTHGVGPMRKYCIGAILLDLDDPTKIIGQLPEPLIMPNETEREGYVPNVIYSCGSLIHQNELVIPYAMSDYASTYATVPLDELLDELIESGSPHRRPRPKKSILVVEDDLHVQKLISKTLDTNHYRVQVAADGVEALLKIPNHTFDLIVSDIKMPHLDGFQLLKFMRKKKIDIPVIFVTGMQDESYELKSLELGAVDFITKPLSLSVLLKKVEKLLERS